MRNIANGEVQQARVGTVARSEEVAGDGWHDTQIAQLQAKVDNLQVALTSNRRIGAAIGILMQRHKITYDGGFALLRHVSQLTHTKLRDVADEVLRTGTLELPPDGASRKRRSLPLSAQRQGPRQSET
jgi:hypothetical protein